MRRPGGAAWLSFVPATESAGSHRGQPPHEGATGIQNLNGSEGRDTMTRRLAFGIRWIRLEGVSCIDPQPNGAGNLRPGIGFDSRDLHSRR